MSFRLKSWQPKNLSLSFDFSCSFHRQPKSVTSTLNDRFCSTLQILPGYRRSRIDWGCICSFDLHVFVLILQVSRMRAVLAVYFRCWPSNMALRRQVVWPSGIAFLAMSQPPPPSTATPGAFRTCFEKCVSRLHIVPVPGTARLLSIIRLAHHTSPAHTLPPSLPATQCYWQRHS